MKQERTSQPCMRTPTGRATRPRPGVDATETRLCTWPGCSGTLRSYSRLISSQSAHYHDHGLRSLSTLVEGGSWRGKGRAKTVVRGAFIWVLSAPALTLLGSQLPSKPMESSLSSFPSAILRTRPSPYEIKNDIYYSPAYNGCDSRFVLTGN